MDDVRPNEITHVKVPFPKDAKLEPPPDNFWQLIAKAALEAQRNGIKANSVVINKNMIRVKSFPVVGYGGIRSMPDMICGLNVYLSENDLPDGYSFAVFEGPENRLAQFEAIGMEPDELRKAAEIYRKIKEVQGDGL